MGEQLEKKRTAKGEQARQRILDVALKLFGSKGYEETTMREIATEAGFSPGLTYRYFASKEELVLALYEQLCTDLDAYVQELSERSLVKRYHLCILKHLELMEPHREALSALFGTALNTRSKIGVFGEHAAPIRQRTRRTYLQVIRGAKDAPGEAHQGNLATLLYGVHLLLVLFWLIDTSKQKKRAGLLLIVFRDLFKLVLPFIWLPPVSHILARLAHILGPMLGDESMKDQDDVQSIDL